VFNCVYGVYIFMLFHFHFQLLLYLYFPPYASSLTYCCHPGNNYLLALKNTYLCAQFHLTLFQGMISLYFPDLGGYRWPPTYSTGSKNNFYFGSFFLFFRVLKFQGHFEALNNAFLVWNSHTIGFI
jgi:hypothetical protein